MRQAEQQLLGICRPTSRSTTWRGPTETPFLKWRRLAREQKAHEQRKARIWAGITLPKLGRMP